MDYEANKKNITNYLDEMVDKTGQIKKSKTLIYMKIPSVLQFKGVGKYSKKAAFEKRTIDAKK